MPASSLSASMRSIPLESSSTAWREQQVGVVLLVSISPLNHITSQSDMAEFFRDPSPDFSAVSPAMRVDTFALPDTWDAVTVCR